MAVRSKIVSLDALIKIRETARHDGRVVVHCHGCFDIVHPGHIHHLQHARSLGDLLIVSVSSDANVSKGIDRPLIPDDLRAQSLAALECVDGVYLNPHPTAVELLSRLKPDIYVKGREYETNSDPRFLAERDAVTHAGGRVVFSSGDIVYSSTAIIGQKKLAESMGGEKVQRFRQRHGLDAATLQSTIHRFAGQRVLVIGDFILDRYHFCAAEGMAGEAPIMAMRAMECREYDGGAGIVAAHLAALGARPTLFTNLAASNVASELRMRAGGINVQGLKLRRDALVKNRYLVDESKMFKVDEGSASPLDSSSESIVADQILAAADGASACIFADFGYGTITAGLLDRIMPTLRARVPVLTADVSGRQTNLLRFQDVDLLCPTEREARESLHDFSNGLGAVVSHLLQSTRARQALITLGKQGCAAFDWPAENAEQSEYRLRSEYLPALPARPIDSLGCGDALLAAASLTLAVGGSLPAAALLGSISAAIEVSTLGNVAVTAEQMINAIHHHDGIRKADSLAA